MRAVLFIFLISTSTILRAQVADYQREFNKINEGLMLTLGSYVVSNFAISGVGYYTADSETTQRFHEMNVMWNTVNLGLAVPGYLKAKRNNANFDWSEMQRKQRKTERIFLINSALDIGYMATGVYMRNDAVNRGDRQALFEGYGNSLLVQGGFLFVFDLAAYGIHRTHYNQKFEKLQNRVAIQPQGTGFIVALRLD